MKKASLLLQLNLIFCWCYSQDYIGYYNLCNYADSAIYVNQYDLALTRFEEAFLLVDYVHALQYEKASNCAVLVGDYEKGLLYARAAILNGNTSRFWEQKQWRKFRKTPYYPTFQDSLTHWESQHISSINLAYQSLIDSLHYVDQRIIRNNQTVKGNYQTNESNLPENRFDLDALVFQSLIEAMEEYGFPSEQRIGPAGYAQAWVLFHHNVRLPQNHSYLPRMESALKNGEYLPSDFAWMYDQGRLNIEEEPLFYYGVRLPQELTQEKRDEIDAARRAYGIKPLASVRIKSTGKRTMIKVLW